MLLYESPAGDYYALCGNSCLLLLREWLTDPDAVQPNRSDRSTEGYAFRCFFCREPVNPTTWGGPLDVVL